MIALLIAIGALAVGNIHGQYTVASFVIKSQTAAVPPSRRPAVIQEISQELQPPPPPQQPSYQDRDGSEPLIRTYFGPPSRPIVRNNEPRIRTSVTKTPVRMDLPSNRTNVSRAIASNNIQNNLSHNADLVEKSRPKQVKPVKPVNETRKDSTVSPEKPTVLSPSPTTNVTFDERANFDGNQCPTGYVRVNGKCVEAD